MKELKFKNYIIKQYEDREEIWTVNGQPVNVDDNFYYSKEYSDIIDFLCEVSK